MEIYLDNSATTKISAAALEIMNKAALEDFGNPSSLHQKGLDGEHYIKAASAILAKILKVNEKEIVYTSGGTESNNMAIIGTALANKKRGMHIISSNIEHASVYNPLIFLENFGYEVDYISVDSEGRFNLEELKEKIRKDTILVTLMHVNNEIGTIEPIEEAAKIIHEKNPDTFFHVDAIQSFGKMKIYPSKIGVDMLSVSSHKLHGPKGMGFLYIKDKTRIKPIIYGGGQQKDMRSGTQNVPGIAGMAKAAAEIYDRDFDNKVEALYELREYFVDKLKNIEGVTINGAKEKEAAPHIVSASFEGVRAEVLLHALEDKKIYVSSGSACSSNHPAISGTLKAIGVKPELLDSTIRFSLCYESTKEEIDIVIEELNKLLPMLRKFTRK